MKNLSFALALALICISMFSCGEKSVISPLSEDFKITTFSPISGFTASEVTLFGENLDKDSIVSVKFGDQTAEILSRSSDSLVVRVPRIAVGKYDITVKTKTKSYVYDKQFEVLQQSFLDDLTQIKNYSVSITGFRVKYEKHSEYQEADPTKHGSSTSIKTDTAFSMVHHNKYPIIISQDGTDKCKGLEQKDDPYRQDNYAIHFQFDKINNKFVTLKINCYDHKETPYESGTVTYDNYLQFDLSDIKYELNNNQTSINVKLYKTEIVSKLSNFSFYHYNGYVFTYGNRYSKSTDTFLELLGINDDAFIEIKFTK